MREDKRKAEAKLAEAERIPLAGGGYLRVGETGVSISKESFTDDEARELARTLNDLFPYKPKMGTLPNDAEPARAKPDPLVAEQPKPKKPAKAKPKPEPFDGDFEAPAEPVEEASEKLVIDGKAYSRKDALAHLKKKTGTDFEEEIDYWLKNNETVTLQKQGNWSQVHVNPKAN
jgi:hypothetical protein